MVTAQPKKILHSLRFFVLRTIASLIFIPTILLLCTVSIIKPLALHNAGDRRNAVPCAALGCMKFTLVFLTLFFQRCNLHSDPTSFPVCSATPRFQLHFRPCELWRSPASGLHPTAHELLHERNMTLYQLCQSGNIPYTTLRVSRCRGSQLSVDTIEQICKVLGISMAEFFTVHAEAKSMNDCAQ